MDNTCDVALVGMAVRFPGARTVEEFWRNLIGGVESIGRFSDEDLLAAGVKPETLRRSDYVKAAPMLDDPGLFDAGFFGYSPGEAAMLDPQQRLLLELAQTALDDAACDPSRFRGRIGVFAGSAMNTYFLDRGLEDRFAENYLPTLVANDKDFLATRISYKLGLRGPSLTVQTACSTSLTAVHLARQSLLNEETDLALAGAVSIRVPHRAGYFYDGSGVVSPDGHVRAFDAGANGTVFGSGAGMVVLKRLADALAQGDRIHAVIKGSAVNNDGADKAGYTAPSVQGQADVVLEALADAGVSAETISYLEAHGSGTPVGDQIEVLALTRAFRRFPTRNRSCALGSVKPNVGHLDAAAGMAGLIKTVLALKHRQIPPTLHYTRPNAEIDFPATPFFVNAQPVDWASPGAPRRAGVMATGMGGTNAHLVLEEAPETVPAAAAGPGPHLLLWSAQTPAALAAVGTQLADTLEEESPDLAAVASGLQTGRRFFPQRKFVVAGDRTEAVKALRAPPAAAAGTRVSDSRGPVTFLFPGVGDHYPGMGRGLYERFPVFRREVDRCAEILQPHLGLDVRELLYARVEGAQPRPRGIDLKAMLGRAPAGASDPAAQKLGQTRYAQPALFLVEYALAQLWLDWGVRPGQLVGHSMGEYVAACLAGVFSLPDALRLVAVRARLVQELPAGAMLAVMLPEREVIPLLGSDTSLALINGPNLCVVAGPPAAIGELQKELGRRQAVFRPVKNPHAFHSRMIDPIAAPFAEEVRRVALAPPQLPFISNVTGTWITPEQATDPLYWVDHARRTARFSDALDALWQRGDTRLVEVGPGRTLEVLAMQHPARAAAGKPLAVSSLRPEYENQPDAEFLLHSLGRLWQDGAEIDWERVAPRQRSDRLTLPAYPFERSRHWLEARRKPVPTDAPRELADWFSVPSWTRTPFPQPAAGQAERPEPFWLILGADSAFARRLFQLLERRGCPAALACFGERHQQTDDRTWEIRPHALEDYLSVLGALGGRCSAGLNILYLGALASPAEPGASSQDGGFHSLRLLAQALGEQGETLRCRLAAVTAQVHEVIGDEALNPAAATVLGLSGVLAREYPQLRAWAVDLPAEARGQDGWGAWAGRLLDEFAAPSPAGVIAYRGTQRWERAFRPLHLAPAGPEAPAVALRQRGVYLITGGTGGLGLAIAKFLAGACRARLILTRRTPYAPESADGTGTQADRTLAAALREIAACGGEAEVCSCDVTDRAGMRRIVAETLAKYGSIHGAVHAAGVLGDGMTQVMSRERAESVLAPKVAGTWVLYELLRDHQPDFIVLFSSLASVVPVHGQGAYGAANAFLDAFAPFAQAEGRCRTLAINWPGWRETGLLADLPVLAGLEARKEAMLRRAILTRDGVEAFRRGLASGATQLVVSPEDLATVRAEAEEPVAEATGVAGRAAEPREARAEPQDEVEQAVAKLWSDVLGLPSIEPNVSFFALGGHSLLAMRIVAQIRSAYQIGFTLRKFFEEPTIAGIARAIRTEIVAEIEAMSEDEAVGRTP